jgi:hypothetical protein
VREEGHALTGVSRVGGAWPLELLDAVTKSASRVADVAQLRILGSARQPELMDRWSDVDVGLVLSGAGDGRSTCRVVLDDGRRLDLIVGAADQFDRVGGRRAYSDGRPHADATATLTVTDPPDASVNGARFVAALAVVKYGRGDLLIGSHLPLELAQLRLVQAMLLRDRDEETTSHRFGTHRDDLAAETWSAPQCGNEAGAVRIQRLVEQFDQLHSELDNRYVPDWSGLVSLTR